MVAFHPSRELQTLFDHAPIGLLLETFDGKILYANTALAHILGYSDVGALLRMNATSFYRDTSERAEILEQLKRREPRVNKEIVMMSRVGTPRRVLATFTLSEDFLSTTMLDVTQGPLYPSRIDRLNHAQLLELLDGVRDMLDVGQVELVYDCITRLLSSTIGSEEYHGLTMELALLTRRVDVQI